MHKLLSPIHCNLCAVDIIPHNANWIIMRTSYRPHANSEGFASYTSYFFIFTQLFYKAQNRNDMLHYSNFGISWPACRGLLACLDAYLELKRDTLLFYTFNPQFGLRPGTEPKTELSVGYFVEWYRQ